jgi:hypothetical protein
MLAATAAGAIFLRSLKGARGDDPDTVRAEMRAVAHDGAPPPPVVMQATEACATA